MKKYLVILYICLCFIVSGCGSEIENNDIQKTESQSIITSEEAKKKIENGAILIDVRTLGEYNSNHIEGALLLSVDEISETTISIIAEDKETVLIVYCASGNRSAKATKLLNDLGYKNVYDLGSINNW